jgi:hypothetical protein
MNRRAAVILFLSFAAAVTAYEIYGFATVHSLAADFRAFWCGGSAVLHGADPYVTSSLARCEHSPALFGLYAAPPGLVVPAPLPPYGLAMFVPFALLSFPLAGFVWALLTIGALLLCFGLLATVLRIPRRMSAWMLLLPAALLWLPYGEATPFALLGALLAASGLQRQRMPLAAIGLALMAIEPHLALGAWICAALVVPRMRLWLALAGVFLIGVSFAVHPSALLEYVRDVLPLHALAELPRQTQYSASWIANAFGVVSDTALRIGEVTYVLALVAGIWSGYAFSRRWKEPAALVFAPLAAAVIGGTFVHASQVVLAAPFAALLATRESGTLRHVSLIACALLCVPWLQGGQQQGVVVLATIVVYGIALAVSTFGFALRAAACAAVLALVLAHRFDAPISHAPAFPVQTASAQFASASWGQYIWREQSEVSVALLAAKMPSWLALLLVIGCAAAALADKEPVSRVGVHEAPIVP